MVAFNCVKDLLSGYEVDKDGIQAAGNMVVVPITSATEFNGLADTTDVRLAKDPDYGRLEFTNTAGSTGVVIQGWTLLTEQHAQDRTVPFAHLVAAKQNKLVPANCVESSQPGYIQTAQVNPDDFMILPPQLRFAALTLPNVRTSYSALWDAIDKWEGSTQQDHGTLRHFYSKHQVRLNEFIAQFEPVRKQLGAMVFINGQIMSIDILPSYQAWKSMWRPLIRDSYGAEAQNLVAQGKAEQISYTLQDADISSLEDLSQAFEGMSVQFVNDIKTETQTVIDTPLTFEVTEQLDALHLLDLSASGWRGQGVAHGDNHIVYLSFVSGKTQHTTERKKTLRSLRQEVYPTSGFQF